VRVEVGDDRRVDGSSGRIGAHIGRYAVPKLIGSGRFGSVIGAERPACAAWQAVSYKVVCTVTTD